MSRERLAQCKVIASGGQISSDISGEAVILNLNSGVYFSLNRVGARIWELIQKPRSVHEIQDAILKEFNVEPERCERDVIRLLEQLDTKGLIELRDGETA